MTDREIKKLEKKRIQNKRYQDYVNLKANIDQVKQNIKDMKRNRLHLIYELIDSISYRSLCGSIDENKDTLVEVWPGVIDLYSDIVEAQSALMAAKDDDGKYKAYEQLDNNLMKHHIWGYMNYLIRKPREELSDDRPLSEKVALREESYKNLIQKLSLAKSYDDRLQAANDSLKEDLERLKRL